MLISPYPYHKANEIRASTNVGIGKSSLLLKFAAICSDPKHGILPVLLPVSKDYGDYRRFAESPLDGLAEALATTSSPTTRLRTAEVPLTPLALEAFGRQMAIARESPFLFPSDRKENRHQTTFKKVWAKTLRRAKIPYFRIYDLRSTYATRLSAGGVADEWVTQMLRQGDARVFKKYSQMKLQMKRDALEKLNRQAGEIAPAAAEPMCTVMVQ